MANFNDQQERKVSNVVAQILALNGVQTVFGISGGASLHLLHGIRINPNLRLVTNHHEQASAMAADAMSRFTGNIGVAIATSGPGATNLVTGIAGCYFDSIPALFITGQVSSTRMRGNSGVRQIGFQETDIVSIVKSITKYAVQVKDENEVIAELEKCIFLAKTGRGGPTLIDIPDDIQRRFINSDNVIPRSAVNIKANDHPNLDDNSIQILKTLVMDAQKPVVVIGWGVHLSQREQAVLDFVNKLAWPVVLTWGASDFMPSNHSLRGGTFGTHGTRSANFIIQDSDLVLSIGSRLDTKATGSPPSSFAPNAKIIMLDIDPSEIGKFSLLDRQIDLGIQVDFKSDYFIVLLKTILEYSKPASAEWEKRYNEYRQVLGQEPKQILEDGVNPYSFIDELSKLTPNSSRIILDTGCAVAWTSQKWNIKDNQRVYHDYNNTAMGWSLPAALASTLIDDGKETLVLVGDGSFMMNIQELSIISESKNPVKIFILNNYGYSMIKQTQDQWFDSSYFASNGGAELPFPNFQKIAKAFGFGYSSIKHERNFVTKIESVINSKKSEICEVIISEKARVIPQVKFGSPIQVMEPPIDPDSERRLFN